MMYIAGRQTAEKDQVFLDMMKTNPISKAEFDVLLKKRPELWGRYAGYFETGGMYNRAAGNRAGGSKRAYHYTARIKGAQPTRFYVEHGVDPARAAAAAFSAWADAPVTLWPGNERGTYRANWFDKYADRNRETELTIVEEYDLGKR